MGNKSVLVAVADARTSADITLALGDGWEATSVTSEPDALAQLEQRSFDALVADFNLGSPDASQLLNQALEKRPETVRFLLAYEADLALVAAKVSGPHEILPKPVEPASLKSRIERGVARSDSSCNDSRGDAGSSPSTSPEVPAVYAEVLKALDLPGVTKSQVGEIVAKDAALTSEMLRLTDSAYLGLPRKVSDPVEAVELIGLETVKAVVMALQFLAEHSRLKPGYLSLEQIWHHSTNVAQLARDLTLFETQDRVLATEALVAGLLHDLGKVVLASNFDDLYGRVHSLARKQPVALWDIEKEMFGASHSEIGACLVGMWNMPRSVVEAVACHHEPPLGEHQHLTPLAAVHIANVLEHQIRPSDEFRVAPVINPAFLNELGLLERLPIWCAAFADRPATSGDPAVEPAETSQVALITPVLSRTPPPNTVNQLPAPARATQTATLGQPGSGDGIPVATASRRMRWVYAGAAAAALGMLALWLDTLPSEPVRALAPAPAFTKAPAVTSALPAPEPLPAALPDTASAIAVTENAPATKSPTIPELPGPMTEPEPTPVVAPSQATVTNVGPVSSVPEQQAQPVFRLNGIIYTVRRPSAILNGQTVCVGDQVSGATVVGIDRTHVTLQINGQRIICVLE